MRWSLGHLYFDPHRRRRERDEKLDGRFDRLRKSCKLGEARLANGNDVRLNASAADDFDHLTMNDRSFAAGAPAETSTLTRPESPSGRGRNRHGLSLRIARRTFGRRVGGPLAEAPGPLLVPNRNGEPAEQTRDRRDLPRAPRVFAERPAHLDTEPRSAARLVARACDKVMRTFRERDISKRAAALLEKCTRSSRAPYSRAWQKNNRTLGCACR